MKDEAPLGSQIISISTFLLPIGVHPASESASTPLQNNQSTLVTLDPEIVAVKDHNVIEISVIDAFYRELNNIPGIITVDL